MKKIALTQGKFALVSNIDYAYLNQWKWCAHFNGKKWYVVRSLPGITIYMHRLILEQMGYDNFNTGDHKDGDGFNNQRRNLRPATFAQNSHNHSKTNKNNTSKFTGVGWHKVNNKWRAYLTFNRKYIHLGDFISKNDARLAYNTAASKYFGKFARGVK
jgi:hypothetical protein